MQDLDTKGLGEMVLSQDERSIKNLAGPCGHGVMGDEARKCDERSLNASLMRLDFIP
jgi:hypothetical protein